jgi:hypothetical protein
LAPTTWAFVTIVPARLSTKPVPLARPRSEVATIETTAGLADR